MTEPSIEQLRDAIETYVSEVRSGSEDTGERTDERTPDQRADET